MKQNPLYLLNTEYQHLGNFYPVALMIGILCAVQGVSLAVVGILGAVALLTIGLRKYQKIGILLLLTVAGYGLMLYRIWGTDGPVLSNPIQAEVQGFVEEVHQTPFGERFILSHVRFLNRLDLAVPDKIKLYQDKKFAEIPNQSWVSLNTFIRPPFSKTGLSGYDEAFDLKFKKIGAVGEVKEILEIKKSQNVSLIDSVRKTIATHIRKATPEEVAEVLIPLSIGEQSVVSQKTYDLFRAGGITHILSVSGFHLSLLAFFIFLVVRRVFAFLPEAEYIPSKKIAAVLALSGATAYILISGMQVPAIRSLIMIAIVLLAILWDRNALSVRSLSVAAIGILLVAPELVFNISFQLSFMAVLILTTVYPLVRPYIWPMDKPCFKGRFIRYILSFIAIDFLIGLATTPFVIYHFNLYALYSPIGNILMGTIISFWVMPLLFLALVMMPIGGDVFLLKLAGLGVEYVLGLCEKINKWPSALTIFPSFSAVALIVMVCGILLVCLMTTKLRWVGLGVFTVGIMMAICTEKPDLMIGDFGQTAAVRTEKGLVFIGKGDKDYTARNWLLQNGENPPNNIPSVLLPESVIVKGYRIAFREEQCAKADLCFLDNPRSKSDKVYFLYEAGVKFVYLNPKQIRVIRLENRRE